MSSFNGGKNSLISSGHKQDIPAFWRKGSILFGKGENYLHFSINHTSAFYPEGSMHLSEIVLKGTLLGESWIGCDIIHMTECDGNFRRDPLLLSSAMWHLENPKRMGN